ncbi:hypothetical protein QE152_g11263 [Popillia japonica]|uniref:Uncharacterized protein n=1 Tax=Popillia japonica TaxID=7064 RepID=A0AAW1LSY6_POPJA
MFNRSGRVNALVLYHEVTIHYQPRTFRHNNNNYAATPHPYTVDYVILGSGVIVCSTKLASMGRRASGICDMVRQRKHASYETPLREIPGFFRKKLNQSCEIRNTTFSSIWGARMSWRFRRLN